MAFLFLWCQTLSLITVKFKESFSVEKVPNFRKFIASGVVLPRTDLWREWSLNKRSGHFQKYDGQKCVDQNSKKRSSVMFLHRQVCWEQMKGVSVKTLWKRKLKKKSLLFCSSCSECSSLFHQRKRDWFEKMRTFLLPSHF